MADFFFKNKVRSFNDIFAPTNFMPVSPAYLQSFFFFKLNLALKKKEHHHQTAHHGYGPASTSSRMSPTHQFGKRMPIL